MADPNRDFPLMEMSILELQAAMESGRFTSLDLVKLYTERIAQVSDDGPTIKAVIEINPEAEAIARQLDAERAQAGKTRGPLHGIPILLKDNIDTGDQMTTAAGSLALAGTRALKDAFIVSKLREAGAVILGKTNLSEWANFRSNRSSSGWSGRGGQARNPYVLDRSCSGSSSGSGSAVAANLCAAAIGTETDGSVVSPSSANGIVGIKPTLGMLSRSGIIPIAASQDTAGPMTRTVADAAILFATTMGSDLLDQDSEKSDSSLFDYAKFLNKESLRGKRIGVLRQYCEKHHPDELVLFESALDTLRALGAEIVDPVELPTKGNWGKDEYEVLLYEFKAGLNAYFATRGADFPIKSITDVITFNREQAATSMPIFGQEHMEAAAAKGDLTDPAYLEALANCRRLTRDEGLDVALDGLDALVSPTRGPAWIIDHVNGDCSGPGNSSPCAVSGYPHITVPMGFVHNLPVNLSFMGRPWDDANLISYAYAYEQATGHRQPPRFLETVSRLV